MAGETVAADLDMLKDVGVWISTAAAKVWVDRKGRAHMEDLHNTADWLLEKITGKFFARTTAIRKCPCISASRRPRSRLESNRPAAAVPGRQ